MPYLPYDEEEKKKAADTGQVSLGGDSNTTINQSAQNVAAPKPVERSGSWTNLNTYLDANKQQGDQMGQTIASNITQKADDATSKINNLATKTATVAAYDPNDVYSRVTNLSDTDKTNYRAQKATGGYTGPNSIEKVDGYADTDKAQTQASEAVNNAKNEYGQQQLLKDTYNRPQYTAGQNKLDQVLLQNSAGSKQALEGVANRFSGITDLFNATSKNVGQSLNTANQQALANKQNVLTGEKNQWDSLINPIQARADQMNKDNPALINRISSDLSDDVLSDETLSRLGLTEGTNLYETNLNSYFNPNNTQVGLNEAANSDERVKYKAIMDLFDDTSRNQINTQGSQINPTGFNKEKFDKDITEQSGRYNAWSAEQPKIDSLYDQYLQEGLALANRQTTAQVREIASRQVNQLVSEGRAKAHNDNDVKYRIDSNNNGRSRTIKKG